MDVKQKKLVVIGFGGHARSVADIAITCGYEELLFVDSNARPNEHFLHYPVISHLNPNIISDWDIFPASGDNAIRKKQHRQILEWGMIPTIIVSPLASIGVGATIASGCFIGHHTHIGPMAEIGNSCIINSGAIVEHECKIGDFSHISVNATVAGRSKLGCCSMLGAGATLVDKVSVCDNVIIGAGALVHRSIDVPGTYVGVPVSKITKC